jgi:hypothetical protein
LTGDELEDLQQVLISNFLIFNPKSLELLLKDKDRLYEVRRLLGDDIVERIMSKSNVPEAV